MRGGSGSGVGRGQSGAASGGERRRWHRIRGRRRHRVWGRRRHRSLSRCRYRIRCRRRSRLRRRIVLDPLRDLCDGRSLFRPRGRNVSERIVPPWCEGGTISSVALTRSEQVRASKARNLAPTEFRIHETPADEVGTINGRCGSGGCGRKGEWGRRSFPVEEWVREVG